ncbi:unnamed protein product, partial [Staurois parvus]
KQPHHLFPEQPAFLLRLPVGFFFKSQTILLAVVAAIFLGLPDLGLVSRDPRTFHFLIGDLTVLIGIFKDLDIFFISFSIFIKFHYLVTQDF